MVDGRHLTNLESHEPNRLQHCRGLIKGPRPQVVQHSVHHYGRADGYLWGFGLISYSYRFGGLGFGFKDGWDGEESRHSLTLNYSLL